jgi:hypothetical protein
MWRRNGGNYQPIPQPIPNNRINTGVPDIGSAGYDSLDSATLLAGGCW